MSASLYLGDHRHEGVLHHASCLGAALEEIRAEFLRYLPASLRERHAAIALPIRPGYLPQVNLL